MRHEPHLYLRPPWNEDILAVSDDAAHHLSNVLKYDEGGGVTYTDGEGSMGAGSWLGSAVRRVEERRQPMKSPKLTIAVAPPKSKDRQRYIVEKLQELGVSALVWLQTERSNGRAPRPDRAAAWAVGALEQSRGAWLMTINDGAIHELACGVVADAEAMNVPRDLAGRDSVIIVVGPEGGLTTHERGAFGESVTLGGTILRTDTAAVAAAASILT